MPRRFREVLTDHLAHLLTIDLPLVAGAEGVRLNRPRPCFHAAFRTLTLGSIPQAVEAYPPTTPEVLEQFRRTWYLFAGDVPRMPPRRPRKTKPRAIVLFSSGKDSLASLGLAREMGLDPVPLYIDDTVSPSENRIKRKHLRKLAAMGFRPQLVTNRVERLNDFMNWTGEESCLGYMHMVTGFALIALPVALALGARYLILGNQQNMNFPFVNKDGFHTYPSFDQTSGWTLQIDRMVRMLTANAVRAASLIEPLTNLGVMKLLVERYADLAELMVSCDSLDASTEPRWCQDCSKCARLAMMMRAFGWDPSRVGVRRDMLQASDGPLYRIFDGKKTDNYERSTEAREEQMLAFLLAVERGLEGPLVARFRRGVGRQAKRNRAALVNKFLTLYPAGTVPVELRPNLLHILNDAVTIGGFP